MVLEPKLKACGAGLNTCGAELHTVELGSTLAVLGSTLGLGVKTSKPNPRLHTCGARMDYDGLGWIMTE